MNLSLKSFLYILIFFAIAIPRLSAQTQLGLDIIGEAAGDYSGGAVAISDDGLTIAIGAGSNDGNGINSGHVRVYKNIAGIWTQVGSDIDGEYVNDYSGGSISLSADGQIVAIGAPNNDSDPSDPFVGPAGQVRVYAFISGSWTKLGADIDGTIVSEGFGASVSLSNDGLTVAIGAPEYGVTAMDEGRVKVFAFMSGAWVQVGSDIVGKAARTETGSAVSLNSDGTVLAIGAPSDHYPSSIYPTTGAGYVSVYKNIGGTWTQIGSDIMGEGVDDCFGLSLALDGSGQTIVIGGFRNNNSAGTDAGHARVYQNFLGSWVQRGSDIDGNNPYAYNGQKVSISYDGGVVAIGASNDPSGHKVYKYICSNWLPLDLATSDDGSGYVVALSSDGLTLGVGFQDALSNKGLTRVYNLQYNPEMDVRGNSISILDGDITPSIADNTDFGNTLTAVTKSFTIFNLGTTSLTLSPSITITGTNASNFTLASGPGLSVSACSTKNFNILFTPGVAYGLYKATITIYSNDPNENPYTFDVQAMYMKCNVSDQGYYQIGIDINGESAGDRSGHTVALSDDGLTLAIGAIANDGSAITAGQVRVYKLVGGTWTQQGSDIDGEATNDQSGHSVSISSDGSIVAIGAPYNSGSGISAGHVRVFQFVSGAWVQMGADIDGETADSYTGYSVSISSDGLTVAIGEPNNSDAGYNAGQVRVFKFIGGSWVKVGSDINGHNPGEQIGQSVSLSSDGGLIATGANSNTGLVRVYSVASGVWTLVGLEINGENTGDRFGLAVSLSSNGSTLAIGAPENDGNGTNSGHARVYKLISNSWTQLGGDLDGEAANDLYGEKLSISDDGYTVAIGSRMNNGSGSFAGHTRVFRYNSGTWLQMSTDIDGEAAGDFSGYSTALNADGSEVAIGAIWNADAGIESGHVRVYKFDCAWPEIDIKGNSTSIAAGDLTPQASDNTDFGSTNSTIRKSFDIVNTGIFPLSISSITCSGINAADFVIGGAVTSVPVGGTATFYVDFTPLALGLRTATININSNDADESVYSFSVQGIGLVVSINSSTKSNILVYPNPFSDNLLIQLDKNINSCAKFVLFDAVGNALIEHQMTSDYSINTSGLASGVYFIHIMSDSETLIFKVIKQ